MKIINLLAVIGALSAGLVFIDRTHAQYRDDAGEVITPQRPKIVPIFDPAPDLAKAYAAAGRPRIALFWNRSLTSTTKSDLYSKETTQVTSSSALNALDKETAGTAGKATLRDESEKFNGTRTRTKTNGVVDDGSRVELLSERNAALLESMFISHVARAGVYFVDRTMIVRSTAAIESRAGGDPKLDEADALLKHAELMLEVQFIPDKDAPVGSGFRISLVEIKTGSKLLNWYSQGIPDFGSAAHGAWVATDHGYEYRTPPGPVPGIENVGVALSRDAMMMLTRTFETIARR